VIRINIAYVVNNQGSKFYGKWVIPIFVQANGGYLCRFIGKHKEMLPVSFEENDLILTKDFKNEETT